MRCVIKGREKDSGIDREVKGGGIEVGKCTADRDNTEGNAVNRPNSAEDRVFI